MTVHYDSFSQRGVAIPAASSADVANRSDRPVRTAYDRLVRRPLDVALVVLGLPVVLPLIAVLALLIARDGGNPFYVQDRVGRAAASTAC